MASAVPSHSTVPSASVPSAGRRASGVSEPPSLRSASIGPTCGAVTVWMSSSFSGPFSGRVIVSSCAVRWRQTPEGSCARSGVVDRSQGAPDAGVIAGLLPSAIGRSHRLNGPGDPADGTPAFGHSIGLPGRAAPCGGNREPSRDDGTPCWDDRRAGCRRARGPGSPVMRCTAPTRPSPRGARQPTPGAAAVLTRIHRGVLGPGPEQIMPGVIAGRE